MAVAQRRSSPGPRRRGARRTGQLPAHLRAIGSDGDRWFGDAQSPARAMQRHLVHRWEHGVADDAFAPRYAPAVRIAVLLGSAAMLWIGLVVAVRLMLG